MIRGERHINRTWTATLAALILSLAWISCTRDDAFDNNNKVTITPVVQNRMETVVQTRALPGYHIFDQEGQYLVAYAIAFTNNHANRASDKDVRGRSFTYMGNNVWRSSLEVEKNLNYNVYAHSPLPGAHIDTLVYESDNNTYLQFTGLSIITQTDPLISTEAAGDSTGFEPSFTAHKFQIGNISSVSGQSGTTKTKVYLRMDHLYAKATLLFSIDSTYNTLRTIRIKSVSITTQENGTLQGQHSISFTGWTADGEISLKQPYAYGGSPITLNLMSNAPTDLYDTDDNQNSLGYVTLTTTDKEFGWFCFLPSIKPECNMSVTYDVVDRKGNVLSTRTATNSGMLSGITSAAHGKNYKIHVIVRPTYIYQLSDDDVEFELDIE